VLSRDQLGAMEASSWWRCVALFAARAAAAYVQTRCLHDGAVLSGIFFTT